MLDVFTWLSDVEWGLLVGIAGLGLSIVLYMRGRKKPIPKYHTEEIRLIRGTDQLLPKNVVISYDDEPVDSLTKTIVTFWNGGRQTLGSELIASSDPLLLSLQEDQGVILRTRILKASRLVNRLSVESVDSRTARLDFEFLDPGDGVAVEILHTGRSSSVIFSGTIKGLSGGPVEVTSAEFPFRSSNAAHQHPVRLNRLLRISLLATTGTAGLLFASLGFIDLPLPKGERSNLPFIIGGLLYVALGLGISWLGRRRIPKALVLSDSDRAN
ncbi:hypothetical protein AB0J43_02285 [Nonomuraea fuscirosea]